MSGNNMSEEAEATPSCCACCGIAEIDDVKLKDCDGCDLVRYCSYECQGDNKSQHEDDCKKRAAELRDELLFKQPESSYLGDCPICMIPLPVEPEKSAMYYCCSKVICKGCDVANWMREGRLRLEQSCPFCREPLPKTDEECEKGIMKRIEANDPVAICFEGMEQLGKDDYRSAFEYFTKASALGNAWAHSKLGNLYHDGLGTEKDEEKEIYHLEEAAIGGHPEARYNLGVDEWKQGNDGRALKHWVIAATQGYSISIKTLVYLFKQGQVREEDLVAALRAHHAAVDAMKSPQREEAEIYHKRYHH